MVEAREGRNVLKEGWDSLCSAIAKGGDLKESPVMGKSWFIFKLVMVNLKFFMLSFFCL